ncbi:DUF3483 domain-containing protein [Spiribacter halobius]|uniref:(Fe-S)-binding protein n=1 Tax=Sediminicurvatus halobius TaxID=2182432 RepID=A0A2U2N6C5_9GAMM|nr:DUF3483 domain-containing protein [Spiribacter halobius]PWG64627.1 (Fe-S)-binding protein [Spiribacter halobius]UEX79050.1 (Fe-S)-binding protein [Spiribacter halobius]
MNAWLGLLPLLLGLGALAWRLRGRLARWRAGRPAAANLLRGLLQVPRRYLVDVHHAVSRNAYRARHRTESGGYTAVLHVCAAGGVVASAVLALLLHPLGGPPWLAGLAVAAGLLAASGAALDAGRRWRRGRSPRLSDDRFDQLPLALGAFGLGHAGLALPAVGLAAGPVLVAAAFALAAAGSVLLIGGMAEGPMRHALAGVLYLAAHPRPQRFGGGRDTAAEPLHLEGETLGADRAQDFPWNRLLGFDACVECGRCEVVCPAFEAGLPLNPKKLIQDLARAGTAAGDAGYTGRGHPDRPPAGSHERLVGVDGMIDPDTLWACTTCRACVDECPMMIEHVDAVLDLRRFQTLEAGAEPQAASNLLDQLRATDTIGGHDPARRLDWAVDLALPRLPERGETDILLWLGESAYELRNQRTLRALVRLLRAAGVDFAVLGEAELDCGDIARRLGDEATFQDLARRNIATLSQHRFRTIVTADPHALHTLGSEYPAFGGHYDVQHHTTFLAGLLDAGRLPVPAGGSRQAVTYHDPCYLGRYQGEFDAPRRLLAHLGLEVTEMAKSRERSSCCGSGGGLAVTDIPGRRRIADVRMEHARETTADTVAVACPHCAVMLEGVVQPRPGVTDVAELLAEALDQAGERAA